MDQRNNSGDSDVLRDGIGIGLVSPGAFQSLLRPRSVGGNGESSRSSFDSVDAPIIVGGITENERQRVPTNEEELFDFALRLTNAFPRIRSTFIRDALERSWFAKNPGFSAPDGNRSTFLHAAVKAGEPKLVSVVAQLMRSTPVPFSSTLDAKNGKGETALHMAAEKDKEKIVDALLNAGVNTEVENDASFTPLQLACLLRHKSSMELLISKGADVTVLTDQNQTILHLACLTFWSKLLDVKDELNNELDDENEESMNHYSHLESENIKHQKDLCDRNFPIFQQILISLRARPDLLKKEDKIQTSPGTALHYFACFNYIEGARILLKEPIGVKPDTKNKTGFSPLLMASRFGNLEFGNLLLKFNPNVAKDIGPDSMTPLHYVMQNFHVKRIDEICSLVKGLLDAGADPSYLNTGGETPTHLAILTRDFQILSLFIEHIGEDSLNIRDNNGNTFFHYGVSRLDENSIFKLIELGGDLLSKSENEINLRESVTFPQLQPGLDIPDSLNDRRHSDLQRTNSILVHQLPLQAAMRNDNVHNYFNAIARLNLEEVISHWNHHQKTEFLCAHLMAAAKEVRPDIVRLIFLQVGDVEWLHKILLYRDDSHEDITFRKTALEWAVENNDRLCTTEILHQEFECHKESKVEGLSCLREQLHGDELLTWTIETFTMFYPWTFAQKYVKPVFSVVPLLISFLSFIYDYYSDFNLSHSYFQKSSIHNATKPFPQNTWTNQVERSCSDFKREPGEYTTAFAVNIVCIFLPMVAFIFMCAKELNMYFEMMDDWLRRRTRHWCIHFTIADYLLCPIWLILSIVLAPFFILIVALRQFYYKYMHRQAKQKNLYRLQLLRSEYYWGISRTAEVGLESCGQLILQVWLLSSNFKALTDDTFWEVVDKGYKGTVFFLTFSAKDANELERNLGKIFLSTLALAIGVTGCYRTLKRGAVRLSNIALIFISLLFQIVARLISLSMYFFTTQTFLPGVPVLLGIHILMVMVLKLLFRGSKQPKGFTAWMVTVINVLASTMVYVRIPVAQNIDRNFDPNANHGSDLYSTYNCHQSTFLEQFLFFGIVLIENLILSSMPLLNRPNRALECLGTAKLWYYMGLVTLFSVLGWLFHAAYYKCFGHPWTDINGPTFFKNGFRFTFHFLGKKKIFSMRFGSFGHQHSADRRRSQESSSSSSCNCIQCEIQNIAQKDPENSRGHNNQTLERVELVHLGQV